MTNKQLEECKVKMKSYRDLFGDMLLDYDDIDNAKSIFDLESIINRHYEHIGDRANDAQHALDRFQKTLNIF